MEYLTSYAFVITASVIVILSYVFNIIAKKTNIPSVLLLIITGFLLQQGLKFIGAGEIDLFPVLEILGIIGLIMIVLEAALDLELKREKSPVIFKSLISAFIGLFVSAGIIVGIIYYFMSV